MTNKEYAKLVKAYEDVKGKGLSLNMARGKPGPDQLAISKGKKCKQNTDKHELAQNTNTSSQKTTSKTQILSWHTITQDKQLSFYTIKQRYSNLLRKKKNMIQIILL